MSGILSYLITPFPGSATPVNHILFCNKKFDIMNNCLVAPINPPKYIVIWDLVKKRDTFKSHTAMLE